MGDAVGIFGGTFDPVHYGHLRAADEVREALDLAELRLVPAGDPPHRAPPGANAAHRVAMLKLAAAEFPKLVVDEREVRRNGKSYTVTTLEEMRREMPGRPLVLVVGADAFLGLPAWHRWRDLFENAHVVVVTRPGTSIEGALPPELAAQWRQRHTSERTALETTPAGAILHIPVTPQPISATSIREALSRGPTARAQLRGLMPDAVLAYIEQHRLYSPAPGCD